MASNTVGFGRKVKKYNYLLWVIFGGLMGLHKFKIGAILTGILYFLTFGLFGLGWLRDIFKVLNAVTDGDGYIHVK